MKYRHPQLNITHLVQPFETTRIRLLKELGFVEVKEPEQPKEAKVAEKAQPDVISAKTSDDRGPSKPPVGTKSTSTPASTAKGPQRASNTPTSASTTKPAPKKS